MISTSEQSRPTPSNEYRLSLGISRLDPVPASVCNFSISSTHSFSSAATSFLAVSTASADAALASCTYQHCGRQLIWISKYPIELYLLCALGSSRKSFRKFVLCLILKISSLCLEFMVELIIALLSATSATSIQTTCIKEV